jgi:hypothetical protein
MPAMQILKWLWGSAAIHDARRSFGVVVVTCLLGTYAVGQEYRTDAVDDKARMNRTTAQRSVKDASYYSAEKARVEEFFTQYYFPAMTRSTPEGLAELGSKFRYELFNVYLWKAHPQFQRDITELAYRAMGRLITAQNPPYHPAVRYNALLVIGMLDEQYATDKPPKPLPRATQVLTTIVDRANTNQFPPVVVLGAVVGLERHAQFRDQLEVGAADAMTAALLKLVTHEQPIQEMDGEAYAWLRLRAATVLAQLGNVGPNNGVHDAIIKLVGEFPSLDDRTATAALLARITYDEAKVDGPATVERLFELARDVGAAEAKRAEDFENAQVGGGMGGFGAGRERMMMMGGTTQPELFPRRHVLARLTELRDGLNGAKKAVADENLKARIDEVLKAIEPVRSAAANKETIELNLTDAIRTMASQLSRVAAPLEKPAEEPAPAPTDEASL